MIWLMFCSFLFTGEDRWLCTLLLKQKYRVDYCAASDALTFAPEGFYEFYKQRRRWAPSTMANILDLLLDGDNVRKNNQNISRPYIFYHICLFISSILTPGTIFLLILGAIITAFPSIEPWVALLLNGLPVAIFIISIFLAKEDTQVKKNSNRRQNPIVCCFPIFVQTKWKVCVLFSSSCLQLYFQQFIAWLCWLFW